ncbi:MAG: hypothetical protein U9N53_14510, partial [Bacteroidota bacterium]|nr:hypothetical protein [Bacteroidota bacterium]
AQFSATFFILSADQAAVSGQLYVQDHLYRMDFHQGGEESIIIIDTKKAMSTILIPAMNMYTENTISTDELSNQDPFRFHDYFMSQGMASNSGYELVEDYNCIVYKITDEEGNELTEWFSEDLNFPIKIEGNLNGGDFLMELKEINESKPDPSIFKVPDDFQPMNNNYN